MAILTKFKKMYPGSACFSSTGTVICEKCGKETSILFTNPLICCNCYHQLPNFIRSLHSNPTTRVFYHCPSINTAKR